MSLYVIVPVIDGNCLKVKVVDSKYIEKEIVFASANILLSILNKVLDDSRVPDDLKDELLWLKNCESENFKEISHLLGFDILYALESANFLCIVDDNEIKKLKYGVMMY